MLILKIKKRGLYLEIPGLLPVRSPADINITGCDINLISAFLRKEGIVEYEIISKNPATKSSYHESPPSVRDSSVDGQVIDKRFNRLESLIEQLLQKETVKKDLNSEQITNKLEKIESITQKILTNKPMSHEELAKKIKREPKIEELDDKFIPSIDISNLKMKSGAKKSIKKDDADLDDSADLLFRLMGHED